MPSLREGPKSVNRTPPRKTPLAAVGPEPPQSEAEWALHDARARARNLRTMVGEVRALFRRAAVVARAERQGIAELSAAELEVLARFDQATLDGLAAEMGAIADGIERDAKLEAEVDELMTGTAVRS
jgi:hypothetical protein